MGGAPNWPKATFAGLAVLVAVGLLFSSGLLPNSRTGDGGRAERPAGGRGRCAPASAIAAAGRARGAT